MEKVSVFIFLLLVGSYGVAGVEPANSTVQITRRNASEFVRFGEIVTLDCLPPSRLTGGLKYLWRTLVQDISSEWFNSGEVELSSNATLSLRINEDFPPFLRIFCHVLSSFDNSTIGVGKTELQVGGILGYGTESGLYNETVTLVANRSYDLSSRSLFQDVMPFIQWQYSNQTYKSVLPSSVGSAQLGFNITAAALPGHSNITLLEPVQQTSGLYEARIRELISEESDCRTNGLEDPPCPILILPLLTYTAVARPVAYHVTSEVNLGKFSVEARPALLQDPVHIMPYLPPSGSWSADFEIPLVKIYNFNYNSVPLILNLFFNGVKISDQSGPRTIRDSNSQLLYPPKRLIFWYDLMESNNVTKAHLRLSLSGVSSKDAGIYEVVFTLYRDVVDLTCCSSQRNFIYSSSGMDLHNYIVGSATVELVNSGNLESIQCVCAFYWSTPKIWRNLKPLGDYPQLTVFADKANITRRDYASLSCNIDSINGPVLSYFKWKKNNQSLLSSEEANSTLRLETTAAQNPYGEFECTVSNGLVANSARLLISESVQIRYNLHPISSEERCDASNEEVIEVFMSQILSGVLSSLCQCELKSANLFDRFATCDSDDGVITYQTTFAYANADGTLTASMLVAEAEQWIVGERNISGTSYLIQVSAMPTEAPDGNDGNDDDDDNDDVFTFTETVLAVIICTCAVAGVVSGIIVACCAIRAIIFMRRVKKSKSSKLPNVSVRSIANDVTILNSLRSSRSNLISNRKPVQPPRKRLTLPSLPRNLKLQPYSVTKEQQKPLRSMEYDSWTSGKSPPNISETAIPLGENQQQPVLNITMNIAYRKASYVTNGSSESDNDDMTNNRHSGGSETEAYDYPVLSSSFVNMTELEDSYNSSAYMN